jgi:hypothetical protein
MGARLGLALVLALGGAARAAEFEFVRDGKAVASIVVASDAPPAEQFAAREFQAILATMSGASLPLADKVPPDAAHVVLVGTGAARMAGSTVLAAAQLDDIRDDGYAITTLLNTKPRHMILLGKEPRGTLFAVHELLESYLDCGFFSDGNHVPRRATVAVPRVSVLGNPAFRIRACYVPTHFYAPKRFQAALWSLDDWKAFLGWMAKKKMNCLVVDFAAASRSWGSAFDRAFPEVRPFKKEMLPRELATPTSKYTARLGWDLHPDHVADLRQKALAYARETLGLEVLYIFHLGQFEPVLRMAHPRLKWLPASNDRLPLGTRSRTACLDATDPKWRELQVRLWQSILKAYGKADHYVLSLRSQPPTTDPGGRDLTLVPAAFEMLKEVDPDATPILSTWDSPRWGQTPAQKCAFLDDLPQGTQLLYAEPDFPIVSFHIDVEYAKDTLYWATRQFRNRPFLYASPWGGGAGNDLFENRFGVLRNQFRHFLGTYYPKTVAPAVATRRDAIGFINWNEIRGVNPLMDDLCGEFSWTGLFQWRGEGAYTNPILRRYLRRRYGNDAVFAISEAYKQAIRGAPRSDADINYRAYGDSRSMFVGIIDAARASIALALGCKDRIKDSPFFEPDLVDLGRNYLHQVIHHDYAEILRRVAAAKAAAAAKRYSSQDRDKALEDLKKLQADLLAAQKTLIRLLATRKDMCLDDAILGAMATPQANPNLPQAVREHQSGLFVNGYPLTDSIEYHSELKNRQIAFFLDYARKEITTPTDTPVPSWSEFFLRGAADFVEKAKPARYDSKAERALPSAILTEYLRQTQ